MLSNPRDEDMDNALFLFSPCHLDLHVVWLGWCVIHLSFDQGLSLYKVSGQYIPEGFYKGFETIVVDVMS